MPKSPGLVDPEEIDPVRAPGNSGQVVHGGTVSAGARAPKRAVAVSQALVEPEGDGCRAAAPGCRRTGKCPPGEAGRDDPEAVLVTEEPVTGFGLPDPLVGELKGKKRVAAGHSERLPA